MYYSLNTEYSEKSINQQTGKDPSGEIWLLAKCFSQMGGKTQYMGGGEDKDGRGH